MTAMDDKVEARKQWDTDPCGAVTAAPVTPESAEWYESVRGVIATRSMRPGCRR